MPCDCKSQSRSARLGWPRDKLTSSRRQRDYHRLSICTCCLHRKKKIIRISGHNGHCGERMKEGRRDCKHRPLPSRRDRAGRVGKHIPPWMISPSTYAWRLSWRLLLPMMSHWMAEKGSRISETCSHSCDRTCCTNCPP